jgi:hypothetical protein
MSLYVAALFFVLTPGVLVSFPAGGKKMTVALVHAVIFAIVYQLTHNMVKNSLNEGFRATHASTAASNLINGQSCSDNRECISKNCKRGSCARSA